MSITAYSGPILAFGQAAAGANPELAPSSFIEGHGMLDPRAFFTYNPGQDFGAATAFWNTTAMIQTVNLTAAAKSAVSIAAAHTVVAATAMTLVSSSALGVTISTAYTNPLTGIKTAATNLAIGGATGRVSFGQSGTMQAWDPSTMTARTIIVTCNSTSGVGGNFKVVGADIYGFPMHETIAIVPASALTGSGLKAWKYVTSVTPDFTDATYTYSVGTTDVFGLPLASLYWGDLIVNENAALVTASTGYLPAVNTLATAVTGDVRGTYALQTASDGTLREIIYQNPSLVALALANGVAGTSSGLYGVAQF